MPDLDIVKDSAYYDPRTDQAGVRVYEVVSVRGENVTVIYEAVVTKGTKSVAQTKAALAASIRAQRNARVATTPETQAFDLGDTVTV